MQVQWVPNKQNLFFSWKNDLSLYRVNSPDSDSVTYDDRLKELAHYADIRYISCLSVRPSSTSDLLVAVGQPSGSALLASVSAEDWMLTRVNRLAARCERRCNALSWNSVESQFLAVGLDRHRNDCCISIWDACVASQQAPPLDGSSQPCSRPYVEIGNSESTLSLAWLGHAKSLAVGMNNRVLRIFDLRVKDPVKPQVSAATRLVYGVCVDPFMEHRMASFGDNQVAIWDQRFFERPVSTLADARTKTISCIVWSPTRRDRLSSLGKESGLLKLYDINHYCVQNGEVEPTVAERYTEADDRRLADISWHPTEENRILVTTVTDALFELSIFERITMNWSPGFAFAWSDGRCSVNINNATQFGDNFVDISTIMNRRAMLGYGILESVHDNVCLVEDPALKSVWSWLHHSCQLAQCNSSDGKTSDASQPRPYQGVRSVLSYVSSAAPTVIELKSWMGVDRTVKTKIHRSEGRDLALFLCGWGSDQSDGAATLTDALLRHNCHSRAAAVAVFQLDMPRAIRLLQQSSDLQLQLVAVALAGFSSDKKALWQKTTRQLLDNISDVYIRIVFAFLTSPPDKFDVVLDCTDINVEDRVAVACRFLDDDQLTAFLERLVSQLKADANLQALLITGLGGGDGLDGLELLQQYINRTGDVQTAALLAAHTQNSTHTNARLWIECYRELLDMWRMWRQRAIFDVSVLYRSDDVRSGFGQLSQSIVACNYCNKSVSAIMEDLSRKRQLARSGTTTRVICCPHCGKSLPRCTLCLTQLGTTAGRWGSCPGGNEAGGVQPGSAVLSTWFTWCQTCRHGGHAGHMAAWFSAQSECPVSGCSCRCLALDSVARLPSAEWHHQSSSSPSPQPAAATSSAC